jgi:hypothetical protein
MELGPEYGYFLEPSKTIIVVKEHNKRAAKVYLKDLGLTVLTGTRYLLGGYVGEEWDQNDWIVKQAKKWTDAVGKLAYVAENHPQAAYAGLQKSLQQEWQFVQRATESIDDKFSGIEYKIQTKFLPALFGTKSITNTRRQLTCLPMKKAGIAIPNPMESAGANWRASTATCGHLVAASKRRKAEFRSATHQLIMAEEKAAMRESNSLISTEKFENVLQVLLDGLSQSIQRGQLTNAWLSGLPSIVNGTELSAEEFCDALTICYGELPSNFPHKCDGCDAHFTLQHTLGCKKGGRIIFCHNKVQDNKLAHLATKAFTPSAVGDKPLI